ncbi:MAG: hypothetical protein LBR16_01700 [Treponema sp.]|jgi:hypothetical protein|nr:hypothetical protein [Treponema sp.]
MKDLSIFENADLRAKTLEITAKEYRPLDPGWYLYRQVFHFTGDKLSYEFIELVYVTLSAWNMNSRGARLSDFSVFEKSLLNNADRLKKLDGQKINMLTVNTVLLDTLKELFFNLELVTKDKPALVTFSNGIYAPQR